MADVAPRITRCYEGGHPGRGDRAGVWFSFEYDQSWIETMKAKIHPRDRSWDPDKKEWWVAAEHEPALRKLFPSIAAYLDQPRLL